MRTTAGWILAFLLFTPAVRADAPDRGPKEFKGLKYRNIGPAVGGRVCRAIGVPGDPLTYYAATAAGGVWKSTDGGAHWGPVTDEMPTSTFGSIAVAPSDANVVYAGSGEANIRGNVEVGNGIYCSTDAGKTWKHQWKQEGQIGRIIVHPKDPRTAFAAVLGKAFGPNPQRGVYRTTDGGATWKRVLFKDADTGASDVCFDPNNPRILFAGLWQTRRKPWELISGGPGSGLYVSRDGGDSWTQLAAPPAADSPEAAKDAPAGTKRCEGLPEGVWGKIGLAVAPSDSKRVYALIEADKGGLFRSDDGGDTWERVNSARALQQRAWYFSSLTVHPNNPNVVYFPQVPLLKTIDGGKTITRVKGPHHGDHHDVWIDPKNPDRMIDSNDGGVDITRDGGKSWYAPPLPICQHYHIATDQQTPYSVACSIQDIGTAMGPSRCLTAEGIPTSEWYSVGGGEAGHLAIDPLDPNVVYATEYSGYLTRYDHRTRQAKSIGVYPYDASGHGAEDLKYRFQWTAPVLLSPHDSKTLYHAGNVLFVTRNGGLTWAALGKDLTRNDRTKQKWSGGPITGDNTGVEVYGTIFALAESPRKKGLLWVGSDDGLVHVSRDGGKTWDNVTAGLTKAGLPEWATVDCIEASPLDAATAYVVADNHRLDDRKPYLFVTTDTGKTWKSLTAKMPQDGYLQVVRVDPASKDMLYVGSEKGVLYSPDAGASWTRLGLNLPSVRVTDLAVKDGDLVVATNGRSIWILDDLTPLRTSVAKGTQFLTPRPAYRYRTSSEIRPALPMASAENPPYGAILHYRLPKAAKEIRLSVCDADGKVVRELSSKKEDVGEPDLGAYSEEEPPKPLPVKAGLHRIAWDLRWQGARAIAGARVDSGNPRVGPLVNPGVYTLKLTVDGEPLTTKVEVKLDPRQVILAREPEEVPLPRPRRREVLREGELAAQLKRALAIRDEISRLTDAVEQMRAVRKQLVERNKLLADDAKKKSWVDASKALIKRMDALEAELHNPDAEVAYDILARKGGAKTYSQLAWLFEQIKDGDGEPTQGLIEGQREQSALLKKGLSRWKSLLDEDLASLNQQAKELGVPGVLSDVNKKK